MMREDLNDLVRKAVSDAVGRPVSDDDIEYILAMHAHEKTEKLGDRLATLTAEVEKDRRKRRKLAGEIDYLKIAIAVRTANPAICMDEEIYLDTRRWTARESPTLTVSLDYLARVLAEECPGIDPADLARFMASLCKRAEFGPEGDSLLAKSEARRYVPEDEDPWYDDMP